mgnify:CR=1 FL=1
MHSLTALLVGVLGASVMGALQEAPDGSVCFNGCNGHGDCIDYSCHCHVGYTGDDCGISESCTTFTALHAPHCTALHCITPHFTHCTTLHALHFTHRTDCQTHSRV